LKRGRIMNTVQKSLRIPEDSYNEISKLSRESKRDFTAIAVGIFQEWLRMKKCPGIIFVDEPAGRRARIAGSGIDVAELIANWKTIGEDYAATVKAYDWLSEPQIRSAIHYYKLYSQEIDEEIADNNSWTEERVRQEFPFLLNKEPA
jgi:uncharacterized protein (DUF433 family)